MNQLGHPNTVLKQMPLGWEITNHEDPDMESPKQVGNTSHPISTITPSKMEEGGALRCSSRICKALDMSNFIMYEALASEDQDPNDTHPMAWKATADPDTMYLHQALKQLDQQQFLEAMDEEIKAHKQSFQWFG